jgi:hypothetical protein
MSTSSTAAPAGASAESLTPERNWAPEITAEFAAVGFTTTGMPAHMNAVQAEAFLTDLRRQLRLATRLT